MTDETQTGQPSQYASDRHQFRARWVEQNRRDSAPVVNDLRRAGFQVEWVDELFNQRYAYREAIPVLLHWLPRIQNEAVKEAIVRALSVKWAKPDAARPLIEEFPGAKKARPQVGDSERARRCGGRRRV